MAKYRMLRDRALTQIPSLRCHEAPTTSDGVIALAHHPHYIHRVVSGALSAEEQRAIGFPWSEAMVERSRRSTGATIAACRSALQHGVAFNLAGGTHHAHADRGQGFCVFNDAAIAARLMQAERWVTRVAIVDLDVHQGDGTASILANDESIFTLSLHAQNNYPFAKACSDLDVALPDDTGDDTYLLQLQHALNTLFERFDPQLIIYLAGADPYQGDRLGRLSPSKAGLAQRDRLVLEVAKARRLPIAIAMAGGYGHSIDETVAIHLQTLSIAREYVMTQPVSAFG